MIDQETIQRIMDATRIEEVIGDFVSLKKRGANHIGCCPFHNEKTPSFYVSPSKGIYKCFGCGEAGDVVSFLRKHEHFTYPEALQYLAKKYNIEIVEEEMTDEQRERQTERDALFHLSEFAQGYFADLLFNDEMGRAVGLSYFHQRGLSDEMMKRFGLGYCLDEWSNFTDHARKHGYSDEVLEKTGLTIFREPEEGQSGKRKAYDRFRGRVMFPIYSISGRVLGFSGRVLSSEKQAAKYVNSPDSDIYNKSRTLYGLYQARSAIAKQNKCYLVEGNIDVISMHMSGVENAVASCGTSLTTEQIRLIKRYTPNVTVLYDGDSAGIKAALRAVNLLFAEGMHVRVVLFPDGEDPDSYAQKYGSAQLQEYLASHEDNFVIFKTSVQYEGVKNDPIKKAELVKETVQTIALVPDLIERAEYISQCSHLLGVPEEVLAAELAKTINLNKQKSYEEQRRTETQPSATPEGSTGNAPSEPEPEKQSDAAVAAMVIDNSERQIVRLLLNHGNDTLSQKIKSEDGAEMVQTNTVAEIIVAEIATDELTFNNHFCQQIFDTYYQALLNGETVDPTYFSTSDNEGLRSFAITLMLDTYNISENWKNKGIIVAPIKMHLMQEVEETLAAFKIKWVEHQIAQNAIQLRNESNPETMLNLIAEKQRLISIRNMLGMRLHRVIC